MKVLKFTYLLFLVVFIGCFKERSSPKEQATQIEVKNTVDQIGKVVITGKTDDLEAFNFFSVLNLSSFSFNLKNYINDIEVIEDSLFLVIDSISSPQILRISAFSNTASYDGQLIVKRNDTVVFEIKNGKLQFIGKNAKQNNFYSSLDNATPKYRYNSYQGNINKYKQNVDSIYNRKLAFFNHYIKNNEITSSYFIDMIASDLKYRRLKELISPRNRESTSAIYLHSLEGLDAVILKEYSNTEVLFDFEDYLGNISIDDFKDENDLNLFSFKGSLIPVIRDYFEDSDYPSYSKEKLLAEKAFIEKNFDNKINEFLIAQLIINYHQSGFGRSLDNVSYLKELINEFEKGYPKLSFKESMQEIREDLESFDFKLSANALNAKLISKFGDTLTLNEIFNRSTKRIKVIDFWASWCVPCIDEITKAKNFRDKLTVEDNVEWIYLSIDDDKDKWLKKSKELKEFLNVRNQYLVLGGKKSPLSRSLKVSWIPRYVIINKENEIVLNNALRPSDSISFKKVINNISSIKQ